MKLPNCEQAVVAREKITEYLLSTTHNRGRHKASYFLRFGFAMDAWEKMADALRAHACAHDVIAETVTQHGTVYRVEGEIGAPDGRRPRVRSVWIVPTVGETPRLVSAYPLGRSAT